MIKVIEKGKTEFIMTCDRCGCKFSYQLEDLGKGEGVTLYPDEKVQCPCCKEWLSHPNQAPQKLLNSEVLDNYFGNAIPTTKNINEGFVKNVTYTHPVVDENGNYISSPTTQGVATVVVKSAKDSCYGDM